MTEGQEFLRRLLALYRAQFDLEEPCFVQGERYDAHGSFTVTNARYVLTRSAELWRANCFEHVFFRVVPRLDRDCVETFRRQIADDLEPRLVREGARWPEKDHMYTYLTAVYICEEGLDPEGERAVRRFRYERNYLCTIRGYCQGRVLAFDLKEGRLLGSRAARPLVKGLTRSGILTAPQHHQGGGS